MHNDIDDKQDSDIKVKAAFVRTLYIVQCTMYILQPRFLPSRFQTIVWHVLGERFISFCLGVNMLKYWQHIVF